MIGRNVNLFICLFISMLTPVFPPEIHPKASQTSLGRCSGGIRVAFGGRARMRAFGLWDIDFAVFNVGLKTGYQLR